ncbi:hypothetical protein F4780DRAFT_775468 [Xylariomycetidae sp. FL0641]|nr:hypothetical protein F4780DRAFT_775468 [Xylariomycetidae sp. FL0641]
MAILDVLPGVEVTVQVNGHDLPEYNELPDATHDLAFPPSCPVSHKYIECVDGVEFAIHACVSPEYAWGYRGHALLLGNYVDGKYVNGLIVHQSPQPVHSILDGNAYYNRRDRQWYRQAPKFATITTVDDKKTEHIERDKKIAKNLGVIELRLYRVTIGEMLPGKKPKYKAKNLGSDISEKALKGKAVDHATRFSDIPTGTTAPSYCRSQILEEDNGETAVFRFYYMSKEALKKELIIPRSPSATPEPDASQAAAEAEVERLREELRHLEEVLEKAKVKKEQDGQSQSIMKREAEVFDLINDDPDERPSKRREVEVIDLTDA